MKKSISYILIASGIVLFLFGTYESNQGMRGEMRLMQSEAGQNGRRPTLGPVRRHAHQAENSSHQQQALAAQENIFEALSLAGYAKLGGIALLVIGATSLFLSRRQR